MSENKGDKLEVAWLDTAVSWMDDRFRIPGTNIRFGFDFLIGLIPYGGDLFNFLVSGILILAMSRHGASGKLLAKMGVNALVDFIIGSIPLLGDLFDLQFRANRRNYRLLKEHYREGKHRGSPWPVVVGLAILLIGLLILSIFLLVNIIDWVFTQASQ